MLGVPIDQRVRAHRVTTIHDVEREPLRARYGVRLCDGVVTLGEHASQIQRRWRPMGAAETLLPFLFVPSCEKRTVHVINFLIFTYFLPLFFKALLIRQDMVEPATPNRGRRRLHRADTSQLLPHMLPRSVNAYASVFLYTHAERTKADLRSSYFRYAFPQEGIKS
jgi:hypothetical protein